MSDSKIYIRYIECKTSINGNRLLDFSWARSDGTSQRISITAASELFCGPDSMSIQECPGICYETLKRYASGSPESLPLAITLTASDVSQHRKLDRRSPYKAKRSRPQARENSMK